LFLIRRAEQNKACNTLAAFTTVTKRHKEIIVVKWNSLNHLGGI
jgi:hypothetical protein